MTVRKYSSISQETSLTSALNSSATTMVVGSASALLGGITPANTSPLETFTVVIDPDTALEEIVDVTYPSTPGSNTITIVRGIDSTSGISHSAGAKVRHMAIGRDFRDINTHTEGTLAQHAATTSAELRGVISDETGTGSLVFATSPTLVTPALGTPSAAVLTNATGLPLSTGVTGTLPVANGGTGVTTSTGSGATVLSTSPTLVTPVLGVATATSINGTTIPTSATLIKTSDTGTVTSTMITDGTIVDADINASAAIAKTKLALTGTITSSDITNDTIVDADINTAAAITKTKISGTAVTLADTGTITSTMILDGTIVNADINASAAIDWTKIAPSATVSTTELGYLDGVTSAIQTQIDSKLATATASSTYAPIASPTFTGVPAAPTATAGTATTQVATTAFVGTAVSNLVASAPSTLDTLNELATALGNDAAFSTTVTNSIAAKLPLAGGTMSGAIAMGTSKITGLGTPTVSTDAATKAYADTMLPLAGGTMSGAIAMGTNKVTGLGTPTTSTDAATKGYVDTVTVAPSNLTGPITSVGAATSIASQTGTGTKFVVDTSPTLVTPVLGVATATSINGTTIPSTKTLVVTTDKLSALAATTSTELAGVISDETGSGSLVFATSPTLVTPNLGTPTAINLTNATAVPSDATKAPLASPTFTGTVTIPAGAVISDPKVAQAINAQTGTTYTFVLADQGKYITASNASAQTYSIPTNASVAFPIGTSIDLIQIGAGQVTVQAVTSGTTTVLSTGATAAGPKTRVQYSALTCKKIATDTWHVIGDIA